MLCILQPMRVLCACVSRRHPLRNFISFSRGWPVPRGRVSTMQRKLTGLLYCPRCVSREVLVWSSVEASSLVDTAYLDGYSCNTCDFVSDTDDRWWCRKCNWDTCAFPSGLTELIDLQVLAVNPRRCWRQWNSTWRRKCGVLLKKAPIPRTSAWRCNDQSSSATAPSFLC